jgi:hypothetical protein
MEAGGQSNLESTWKEDPMPEKKKQPQSDFARGERTMAAPDERPDFARGERTMAAPDERPDFARGAREKEG